MPIFGGRTEYRKAPRREVERQWIRHQAEVQAENERRKQEREEMER